jgi:hypothetical protein
MNFIVKGDVTQSNIAGDNKIEFRGEGKVDIPKEPNQNWLFSMIKSKWFLIGIIIILLGWIIFLHFRTITDVNNVTLILAFVGILATFIVVSNYAQVKEIEKKAEKKAVEIEKSTDKKNNDIICKANANSLIIEANSYRELGFLIEEIRRNMPNSEIHTECIYYEEAFDRGMKSIEEYSKINQIDAKFAKDILEKTETIVNGLNKLKPHHNFIYDNDSKHYLKSLNCISFADADSAKIICEFIYKHIVHI